MMYSMMNPYMMSMFYPFMAGMGNPFLQHNNTEITNYSKAEGQDTGDKGNQK